LRHIAGVGCYNRVVEVELVEHRDFHENRISCAKIGFLVQ
jgi:hypothetical protein